MSTFSLDLHDEDDAQYFGNWLRRCGSVAERKGGIVYTYFDAVPAYRVWRRLFSN